MSSGNTRESALLVLREELSRVRETTEVQQVRDCLTEQLIEEIFEQAWAHQFDESRTEFRGLIRDLVQEALQNAGGGRSNDS